jgi:hypothetical protein
MPHPPFAARSRRLLLGLSVAACGWLVGAAVFVQPAAAQDAKKDAPAAKDDDHDHTHAPVAGVDRHDVAGVARAILEAYKAQNFERLASLADGGTAKLIREIGQQKEQHPRWKSLFAGARWEAVQKWDGKTLSVRYDDDDAVAAFLKLDDTNWAVVRLHGHDHDGKVEWFFEDVNRMDEAKFKALSEKPE